MSTTIRPVSTTIQPDTTQRGLRGLRGTGRFLDEDAPESEAERRARHVLSDAARARRRHLARYVGVAVAIATAICVAAAARAITSGHAEPAARPSPAPTVANAATAPAAVPAAVPAPSSSPVTAVTPPASASPATSATAEPDPAAAREAKRQSQRALERGKFGDAIEAGERSVALDPTDAESWLILGAAYQARGKHADARRCFTSCMRLGKRGPRGECAAMLR
jgi:Flp pilus assembly protein TadD